MCIRDSNNTALGAYAMRYNNNATGCVAVGLEALRGTSDANPLSGNYNTAVGQGAGEDIRDGEGNTFIGYYAGRSHTSGGKNVAVGAYALDAGTTGNGNTCVGYWAGSVQTTQNDNTLVGYYAGYPTTGYRNTVLGSYSGYELTSGHTNLLLGYHAGYSTSPSGTVDTENYQICLGDNDITNAFIKVDWTVTSDRRDKTDIEPFNYGLSWINKLNPVTYRWDNRSNYENGVPDGSKKGTQLNVGLIAQDELEVEKEHGYGDTPDNMLVSHVNGDGNYGMQYSKLVPILVNAVKELSAENTALKARLDAAGL